MPATAVGRLLGGIRWPCFVRCMCRASRMLALPIPPAVFHSGRREFIIKISFGTCKRVFGAGFLKFRIVSRTLGFQLNVGFEYGADGIVDSILLRERSDRAEGGKRYGDYVTFHCG